MDNFMIITVAILIYCGLMILRNPKNWIDYLNLLPLIAFMAYARAYGMTQQSWTGAFEFAGLLAVGVIAVLWQQGVTLNRIMLGVNCFFIVGGLGFLFNNSEILEWYSATKGGPFFGCIAMVGLLSTLFTKAGFIGVASKNKRAIQYASFLLLAVTFCALIWSVHNDEQGLMWAVAIPFIILRFVRQQLVDHLF